MRLWVGERQHIERIDSCVRILNSSVKVYIEKAKSVSTYVPIKSTLSKTSEDDISLFLRFSSAITELVSSRFTTYAFLFALSNKSSGPIVFICASFMFLLTTAGSFLKQPLMRSLRLLTLI